MYRCMGEGPGEVRGQVRGQVRAFIRGGGSAGAYLVL